MDVLTIALTQTALLNVFNKTPGFTWSYKRESSAEGDDAWILTYPERQTICFYGNSSPDGYDKYHQIEALDVHYAMSPEEALLVVCNAFHLGSEIR